MLSLSTWEHEKALVSWRTHLKYQPAQAKGRDEVLIDYTLRTGQLTRNTDLPKGCMLREQRLDDTVAGAGNTAVLVDTTQAVLVPTTHGVIEMASHLGLDLDAAGLTSCTESSRLGGLRFRVSDVQHHVVKLGSSL